MSFAQIKEEVLTMSEEERVELAALLHRIRCVNDPDWRAEIARRRKAAERGESIPAEEVEALHRTLNGERSP